jgi:hypothetical protein
MSWSRSRPTDRLSRKKAAGNALQRTVEVRLRPRYGRPSRHRYNSDRAIPTAITLSSDNKESEESAAVEQEREEEAEPDVESKEEAESEDMEAETEEESEDHESEEIEDRESEMSSDKK